MSAQANTTSGYDAVYKVFQNFDDMSYDVLEGKAILANLCQQAPSDVGMAKLKDGLYLVHRETSTPVLFVMLKGKKGGKAAGYYYAYAPEEMMIQMLSNDTGVNDILEMCGFASEPPVPFAQGCLE